MFAKAKAPLGSFYAYFFFVFAPAFAAVAFSKRFLNFSTRPRVSTIFSWPV